MINIKKFLSKNYINIILFVILIIIIIFMLHIYNHNNVENDLEDNMSKLTLSQYNQSDFSKTNDIQIEVIDDKTTNTSISYYVINNTENDIWYTMPYEIEIFKNGNYYNVSQFCFVALAKEIKAKSKNIEEGDFSQTNQVLEKGKYRLVKKINDLLLYDEFEIK